MKWKGNYIPVAPKEIATTQYLLEKATFCFMNNKL